MASITPKDASKDDKPEWKTLEYHGKRIHVSTALRVNGLEELQGHGQQWDPKMQNRCEGFVADKSARFFRIR